MPVRAQKGHQVVMQYFAQDEATRLDGTLTVYQTLAGDAPIHMVPQHPKHPRRLSLFR